MAQKWLDTIARHDDGHTRVRITPPLSELMGYPKETDVDQMANDFSALLDKALSDLDEFLKSEDGKNGLKLLKALNRRIIFAREEGALNYSTLWFINGDGLKRSRYAEPIDNSLEIFAIQRDLADILVASVNIGRFINAISLHAVEMRPIADTVQWFKEELDKLADSVPEYR
jgi:hypothetical protein